ncbi:MAG: Ribosomal silencing factor RsfS [Planctomycetes bacterium ADurb.Bin126]|nr:MAG: Ribosomal silencing factor RsfS [Planctomycetes bacterium ADurb.Bin126]HOD83193.1 ribosome silencing factor [Phycisphaerae bacterium]HQL75368.1 ribosome silencing factor [Phycisphaerae bacterium]
MAKQAIKKKDEARKLAIEMARAAHDSNCQDVVVLDLREVSPVTDYFVIATGSSGRQMRSTADDMSRQAKKIGSPVWHVAGIESEDWIVLDFVDVVVHLFDHDHRKYYDLELIWGGSPRVRWKRPTSRKPKD